MAKQEPPFSLYDDAVPPVVTVWRCAAFRDQTKRLFTVCGPADRTHFANVNQLIKRFAAGEQLSQESFPKEDVGFAFKSGTLRFYGVFSTKHKGCFVLSHSISKRHQKLTSTDKQRMKTCLAEFDALNALPPKPTRKP